MPSITVVLCRKMLTLYLIYCDLVLGQSNVINTEKEKSLLSNANPVTEILKFLFEVPAELEKLSLGSDKTLVKQVKSLHKVMNGTYSTDDIVNTKQVFMHLCII